MGEPVWDGAGRARLRPKDKEPAFTGVLTPVLRPIRKSLRWIKSPWRRPAARAAADQWAIASGCIGVLRKKASKAAAMSATAMPATQAAQPNMSKISPSTALPIKPPKK